MLGRPGIEWLRVIFNTAIINVRMSLEKQRF